MVTGMVTDAHKHLFLYCNSLIYIDYLFYSMSRFRILNNVESFNG